MNNSIKTYDDLLKEKERLKEQLRLQRQHIEDNWGALKTELEPVRNTFNLVGKMTRGDTSNPLINIGLGMASDLLLRKLLLGKAGWLLKAGIPLLVKNYSSHLIADKGKSLVKTIARLLRKKSHRESEPIAEEPEEPVEEQSFNSFAENLDTAGSSGKTTDKL
ncbi:MAG: hypothetical protein JNL51_16030 [Chitinophagaceae bacterium]|nr:hypothetical protein [Chitinophagaceae bacterium]